VIVIIGCSFSKDATSSSHSWRWLAWFFGGSQLTVMVVGFETSSVEDAAGEPLAFDVLAGELLVAGDVVVAAVVDDVLAVGELLLQPAAATTPATASTVASFWYFIERSLLGCGSEAWLAAAANARSKGIASQGQARRCGGGADQLRPGCTEGTEADSDKQESNHVLQNRDTNMAIPNRA